jgi:uncharacterized membrane-anchored protein YitT (DUF2179 family)
MTQNGTFFLPVANEMLTFLCLLVLSTVIADRATHHNYQVRRVYPENQEQIEILRELENNPNGVSWF